MGRRIKILSFAMFGFLALAFFSSRPASAANCSVELLGGAHIAYRDYIADFLGGTIRGTQDKIRADILDVFDPPKFHELLNRGGLKNSALAEFERYMDFAFTHSTASKYGIVDGGFALLNGHHNPAEALVNLCVVGNGCVGFEVTGDKRPYLHLGVYQSIFMTSLDDWGGRKIPSEVSPHSLNVVMVRAADRPDELIANLFSGLGSAQMKYLIEKWAVGMHSTNHVSELLTRESRRASESAVAVERGFVLFMQNMNANRAEVEISRIFENQFPKSVFSRSGNLFEIENVIARVAAYPEGAAYLQKYKINAQNAFQNYMIRYFKLMGDLATLTSESSIGGAVQTAMTMPVNSFPESGETR